MHYSSSKQPEMKNRHLIAICALLTVVSLSGAYMCRAQQARPTANYELAWQEDFNASQLDTTCWNIIERGPSEWQKFMSSNKSLFKHRRGYIRLYARQNKRIEPADTASYLTGGISTQHKITFTFGKIEVRARIHGATGCWPAIWLKSDNPQLWGYPERAEIDIMEYASHDKYVTQTVHNNYTDKLGHANRPKSQSRPNTDVTQWNTYTVEILPDNIILSVNDEPTLTYPRIETDEEGQFPFGVESFLLIDMQVGNRYLKNIVAREYPAWMDVDWVKIYRLKP